MKQLNKTEDNSVDSIIVNYKLTKEYYDKTECVKLFNAVKPGSHVLLFTKTNIQYMTGVNARLAGFDIRDTIYLPAYNVNVIMARKPLSESTVANNTLKWGTGGLNIDASRIGTTDNLNGGAYSKGEYDNTKTVYQLGIKRIEDGYSQPTGRFPANIILDETTAALLDEQSGVSKSGDIKPHISNNTSTIYGGGKGFQPDITGSHKGDTGGASRFFFKADNDKQLLTYLETLITPLNGKCIKIG